MKMGVSSYLYRVCPKVGLVGKVLIIADALCTVVAVEEPHNRITVGRTRGESTSANTNTQIEKNPIK